MVTATQVKMVTGTINGQHVTVPQGTYILEAARLNGVEIPNLCYQPLLRPWGSCRICTVQILGKRGGMIESCTTPVTDGIEVLTHSPDIVQARQYILQMYLIDHALDCPTCDKSGECYLQDNTYLHNINANPYRRPKLAQPYEHFSATIDYKWDRCIMCNRCTRVCDEVVGVVAIETANRSLESTIAVAYGQDLSETTCTNCGMCIAVCPVGALTDRHFGHHPWELDSTETICGFCDVGCTLNIESNKGIVRRTSHLWERGVNHGYTCELGKWGHEQVQSADRLFYPRIRDEDGLAYEVMWDEAIQQVSSRLAQHRDGSFGALASGENTNEEAYVLQQFTRATMQSNTIDRLLTPQQAAVERSTRASLGIDVAHTNNMQELFSAAKNLIVVGPSIFETAPIASYWINHARHYREARITVISTEHYQLCNRAVLWLQPKPGTTADVVNAVTAEVVRLGYATSDTANLYDKVNLEDVAARSGVSADDIQKAALLFVTSKLETPDARPVGDLPPGAVFSTLAHATIRESGDQYPDAEAAAAACANLAIVTGNLGRSGGGIASLRGPANYQGVTDMGLTPSMLPGSISYNDEKYRSEFERTWLQRWSSDSRTTGGFHPATSLPSDSGYALDTLADAIERGAIRAMIVESGFGTREGVANERLFLALKKLEYLVVISAFDSPLTAIADVTLPISLNLEKDGTFTSFDRTVQRVRAAVPALGEAHDEIRILSEIANILGYAMPYTNASQVMSEIARLVPAYAGVTYARLERNGLVTPVESFGDQGTAVLTSNPSATRLTPQLVPILA